MAHTGVRLPVPVHHDHTGSLPVAYSTRLAYVKLASLQVLIICTVPVGRTDTQQLTYVRGYHTARTLGPTCRA
jgi:hypothetical protein